MKKNKIIVLIIILVILLIFSFIYLYVYYYIPTPNNDEETIYYLKSNLSEEVVSNINYFHTCKYKNGTIVFLKTINEDIGLFYVIGDNIYKAFLIKFDNSYVDIILPGLSEIELPYYYTKESCLPAPYGFMK